MRLIFTISFILVTTLFFAQNHGYMGKKTIIDGGFYLSRPMIQNFFNKDTSFYRPAFYRAKKDGLKHSKDQLDFAFFVDVMRSLDSRISFGVEYTFQRVDAPLNIHYNEYITPSSNYDESIYLAFYANCENLKLDYHSFIPKIEFKNKNSIFGIGISHQFGFGICTFKIHEKDYVYEEGYADTIYSNWYYTNDEVIDILKKQGEIKLYDKTAKYSCRSLQYAINFRKPITERIFINYGFKYNLSFPRENSFVLKGANSGTYYLNATEIEKIYNRSVGVNFIQFKLGASFIF